MTEKGVEQRRRAETSRETVELKRRALELGFDAVGVASLEPNAHAAELDRWLAGGYAGTMTYLHRQAAKRKEPAAIMPEATVAVVTLTNYFHDPGSPARGQPRVAQYAQSADYHRVLAGRLERLADAIRELAPGSTTRGYVDAGPVPERELAQRAGLGWIAKNMMLIHPGIGSFTFIGVVLTDAARWDATPPQRSPTERRERADRRDPAPPHGRARQDRSPPPPARPAGPLPRDRWGDVGDYLPRCAGDRGGGSARREAFASERLLLQCVAADGRVRDGEVRRLVEVGHGKQE